MQIFHPSLSGHSKEHFAIHIIVSRFWLLYFLNFENRIHLKHLLSVLGFVVGSRRSLLGQELAAHINFCEVTLVDVSICVHGIVFREPLTLQKRNLKLVVRSARVDLFKGWLFDDVPREKVVLVSQTPLALCTEDSAKLS